MLTAYGSNALGTASRALLSRGLLIAALLGTALSALPAFAATPADNGVPLVVGNRTVHVFRAPLGEISAGERAQIARKHILRALEEQGQGWTSVSPSSHGVLVELDGKPMFTVLPGDAPGESGESAVSLANQASRTLQKVWTESRERGESGFRLAALLKVAAAFVALALLLALLVRLSRSSSRFITRQLEKRLGNLSSGGIGAHLSEMFLGLAARLGAILAWIAALLAVFAFITYSLGQFALTRPVSEHLAGSIDSALGFGLRSAADAIPGLFVAIVIFLIARITTQVSRAVFDRVAAGQLQVGALDAHTAPATRHLVNAAIWLFALAMAYPYLPGAHTEAFKGLSVLLGIMVSIGASGLVGQIASGLILVYTRALLVGEYVRIQDCEGTVTELGLCVTRLQTGTGEEIALPNSLVISQVTRNFSRNVDRGGFILDTSVTIGYDTPWRQVHAMLLEASSMVASLRKEPAPFVVQSALSDFYVEYRLVVQVGAEMRARRPQVLSDLNAAIQDVFNRYGVQIMSPHYIADPETQKTVPPSEWNRAPAQHKEPSAPER